MTTRSIHRRHRLVRFLQRWWWLVLGVTLLAAALPVSERVLLARVLNGAVVRIERGNIAPGVSKRIPDGVSVPNSDYFVLGGKDEVVLVPSSGSDEKVRISLRASGMKVYSSLVDDESRVAYLTVAAIDPLLSVFGRTDGKWVLLSWDLDMERPKSAVIVPALSSCVQLDREGSRLLVESGLSASDREFSPWGRWSAASVSTFEERSTADLRVLTRSTAHSFRLRPGNGYMMIHRAGFVRMEADSCDALTLSVKDAGTYLYDAEFFPVLGEPTVFHVAQHYAPTSSWVRLTVSSAEGETPVAITSEELPPEVAADVQRWGTSSSKPHWQEGKKVYYLRLGGRGGGQPTALRRIDASDFSSDLWDFPVWCEFVSKPATGKILLMAKDGAYLILPLEEVSASVPAP